MNKQQLMERLMARCSRSEYSTGQVAAYACRWLDKEEGAGSSIVEEIVERLVKEKFVDDRRFAAAFVRDKLKFNGWGRQKIVYKLRSLGVDDVIISEAIAENYNGNGEGCDASAVLERVVANKWKALCRRDERKMANGVEKVSQMRSVQARKAAVIRFAMGRGFDYEEIVKCLNNIV